MIPPSSAQYSFDHDEINAESMRTKARCVPVEIEDIKRRLSRCFLFIDIVFTNSAMKPTLLGLIVALTFVAHILSSPAPIQRNAHPSCPPYSCIIDTSLCFCGEKLTPEDPCCAATCAPCPPDFNVKPWLTFNYSSLNLEGIVFPFLG